MNKLFVILFCLSTAFASNAPLHPAAEEISSLQKPHLDTSLSSSTYSYFSVGSGLVMQHVGIGERSKNFDTCKGSDMSLNVYFSIPMTLNESLHNTYYAFPSFQYTYLNYRDNSPTSRYFGVSCEGILLINQIYPYFFPIPNLGLIWGKERETVRFSQLQLNIFPAVGCILGAGIFFSSTGFDSLFGAFLVLNGGATLLSYDIAF